MKLLPRIRVAFDEDVFETLSLYCDNSGESPSLLINDLLVKFFKELEEDDC